MTRVQAIPSAEMESAPTQRALVRDHHHAIAKEAAFGRPPETLTELILFADPAFCELVAFYRDGVPA